MPGIGGSAFAEDPDLPAPVARLVWRAELDAAVLRVRAVPVGAYDVDAFDLARLACRKILIAGSGVEHLAVSDGWRRIRLDVVEGSLAAGAVRLDYQLSGFASADAPLLTLRRLFALWRTGRFTRGLFPPDPRIARGIEALRVGDALAAGASYREIAVALFGEARVRAEWKGSSESMISRVRRRAAEARHMAAGGWRELSGS